jgi:hypothetical protein
MKKKHLKILQEINKSIPQDLLNRLMKKELATPAIAEVVDRALGDEDTPADKKERLQAIKDGGFLSIEVEVIDENIERQIDEFITQKVKDAVDKGLLPKEPEKLKVKSKQYVRRSKKGVNREGTEGERTEQDNGRVSEISGRERDGQREESPNHS